MIANGIFILLWLAYALLDSKRHAEIINNGQSPHHLQEFLLRCLVGVAVLFFVSFHQERFIWYWTLSFMVLSFWPTFNMGVNRFRRPKKPWMYLDNPDDVEDSKIDVFIQKNFNGEVFGYFLIAFGVIATLVFLFYGHLEYSEI